MTDIFLGSDGQKVKIKYSNTSIIFYYLLKVQILSLKNIIFLNKMYIWIWWSIQIYFKNKIILFYLKLNAKEGKIK